MIYYSGEFSCNTDQKYTVFFLESDFLRLFFVEVALINNKILKKTISLLEK